MAGSMEPNQLNSTVQSVRFMALEREKKMKPDKKHDVKEGGTV